MTLAARPGAPAARPAAASDDAAVLLCGGHDRRAPVHLRLLVVSVVRLGVAAMEAAPLLRHDVGGPAGPLVLLWLVVSATVVGLAAVAALRGARPALPAAATERSVVVGDVLAYAAVAVTASGGYGPIVVLGMMLLAQVPMRWGLRGALLAGVPLTTVSLLFPSSLADTAGGRVALVVAIVVATGLGLALGRFLDREGAVHERTQRVLSLVFDHSPTATALTTTAGTLVQVNAALCSLTGLPAASLVGTSLDEHVHPDDVAGLGALVATTLAGRHGPTAGGLDGLDGSGGSGRGPGAPALLRLQGPRGPRWAEVLLGVLPAGGGLPARLVVQVADVDDRRATAQRLEHEATHDPLTGLPNRRALHRALDALVADPDARGALVLVDLDGFKAVNDRYGHEAGDDLLVVAASRLRSCLRPGEMAARLAGDEMVVLSRDAGPHEALGVGRRVVQHLVGPARLGDGEVVLRASAGVRTVAAHDDPRAVLRDADAALYEAKRSGGSTARLAAHGRQVLGGRVPGGAVRASAPARSAAAGA